MHSKSIFKISLFFLSWVFCLSALPSTVENNYFDQFIFSTQGSCDNIYSMYFNSTSSIEFANLGPGKNGGKNFATLTIQLFENSTYWAKYSEQEAGATQFKSLVFMNVVQGNWSVENGILILTNLGSGSPEKYQVDEHKTLDSIRFRFNKIQNDPRILNTSMNLTQFMTNIGPKGKSAIQYCNGL